MSNWSDMSFARPSRKFEDESQGGVAVWHKNTRRNFSDATRGLPAGVVADRHFPETTLQQCIGKCIHDVISHPEVREGFGPDDTIKSAFNTEVRVYDSGPICVFEIKRKRGPRKAEAA